MKKIFILSMVFTLMFVVSTINMANAEENTEIIQEAIGKYKDKNYVGCISDLRMYVEKNPNSTIAWYYLGGAYMNIAMKTEAHYAFDKVILLNTVPKLTSYSIQAKICMENPTKCDYQDFSQEQIIQLKANPMVFLDQYFASLRNDNKDANTVEIEKLINGSYSNNIHPSAKEFIMQERAKIKQNEINVNKAYLPSDAKFAHAIDAASEQNNNISSLSMIITNSILND